MIPHCLLEDNELCHRLPSQPHKLHVHLLDVFKKLAVD
jgi:hypothetical protein